MHAYLTETAVDRALRAASYFAGRRAARAVARKASKVAGAERKAALLDAQAKAAAEHAAALEAERARREAVEQARAQYAIAMAAALEQDPLEREAYLGLKRLGVPYRGLAFADMVQQFALLKASMPVPLPSIFGGVPGRRAFVLAEDYLRPVPLPPIATSPEVAAGRAARAAARRQAQANKQQWRAAGSPGRRGPDEVPCLVAKRVPPHGLRIISMPIRYSSTNCGQYAQPNP